MICRMNLIHCEFANSNGYCERTACCNPNIVGNTIKYGEQKAYSQQYVDELKAKYSWHTGTPTEDGWYLVAYECVYDCKNKGKIEYFTMNIITDEDGYRDYRGRASDDVWKAVAYQKIEPYEGTEERE